MRKISVMALLLGMVVVVLWAPSWCQLPLETGRQNPRGIDWKEIKTAHFRIIFPAGILEDAERVAATLEHVYPYEWVPLSDPYLMGYYLTTHVRRNHDADVWGTVLDRNTVLPFIPHWFSCSVKNRTGKGAVASYEAMLDEVTALWTTQIEGLQLTEAAPIHAINKQDWTHNARPQFISDSSVAG